MDQATQVNFPIVPKNLHRKMQRHNTSADLFHARVIPMHTSNSWSQLKPLSLRPKSLNLQPDNRLISYSNQTINEHNQQQIGSISRERTPPFSSNSSMISMNNSSLTFKPPPYAPPFKPKGHDDDNSNSCCKCACRCVEDDLEAGIGGRHKKRKSFSNTAEGLSWRRLHMSRAKLKATATTSELLSGFAMIAMVELQINDDTKVPEWLFVMFAVCTTILVAVHIFALMISTYILPNIEAIAKLEICEIVAESPHERMKGFIELAWAFSTILGLFLFLVEVAILCWVKFWDYSFPAATAATVIVIPVLIVFVLFAVHFYHSVVVYKCDASMNDMEKLEDMKKQLDEVTSSTKIV